MKKLLAIIFMLSFFTGVSSAGEKIPEWFNNIPESTESIIYGKGEGSAADLDFSQQKALSNALLNLCKIIKINNENFVCKFSKYEIENHAIAMTDNGSFRTFLLLKYKLPSE